MVEVKFCDAQDLFRCYTRCQGDPVSYILDIRPKKDFQKAHLPLAYCVRLTANGAALLDYSGNEYAHPWSAGCYAGRPVFVYGPAGLRKDDPIVAFLQKEGLALSIGVFRDGFDVLQRRFPYLVTASVARNSAKAYPSEIIPGLLYLGDFEHARAADRLKEINVKNIVTIHNHPEHLSTAAGIRRLMITMADLETEQIAPHFESVWDFIEAAAQKKEAVLIHCGAGVSRSACLVMSYLMRKHKWNADTCDAFVKQRRSIVQLNAGFWAQLCQFEALVGITDRSDPRKAAGFHGADSPGDGAAKGGDPTALLQAAVVALESRPVLRVSGNVKTAAAVAEETAAAPPPAPPAADDRRDRDRGRERGRGRDDQDRGRHSRSRSRDRHRRHRSRSRSRDRDRRRSRSRSRDRGDRDRGRDRHRDEDRNRDRGRGGDQDRDRDRVAAAAAAPPPPPPAPDRSTEALLAQLPPSIHPLSKRFTIDVLKEGSVVGTVKVECLQPGQRVVFGRAADCEVVLEHPSSSRQHAQLSVDVTGTLVLADLGSAHGTSVDGAWLKSKGGKGVGEGTQLRFGASTRSYVIRGLDRVV